MCQSVGRQARRANTSDKPERSSHTFGDDRKPELSASCLTAFVRRLRPLGPISAPANPTGKGKGIWVRRPNCKSVDAERTHHAFWALPRGYEANRLCHSNHCGGDRETEYDPPVTPVRNWRAVVGSEWSTNPTDDSDRTGGNTTLVGLRRLWTHRRLAV